MDGGKVKTQWAQRVALLDSSAAFKKLIIAKQKDRVRAVTSTLAAISEILDLTSWNMWAKSTELKALEKPTKREHYMLDTIPLVHVLGSW